MPSTTHRVKVTTLKLLRSLLREPRPLDHTQVVNAKSSCCVFLNAYSHFRQLPHCRSVTKSWQNDVTPCSSTALCLLLFSLYLQAVGKPGFGAHWNQMRPLRPREVTGFFKVTQGEPGAGPRSPSPAPPPSASLSCNLKI